jgi:prevent-host-death family protein
MSLFRSSTSEAHMTRPGTVNVHEAKAQLSRLLTRVASGEIIVIARAGKPIARLEPLEDRPRRRVLGQDRGLVVIHPEFFDPIPELEEYF